VTVKKRGQGILVEDWKYFQLNWRLSIIFNEIKLINKIKIMGVKNKWNSFIEKLTEKSFKTNAIIFAILWVVYIVISWCLTFMFATSGWSTIVTIPLAFLFYLIVFLVVLAGLILYCFNEKTLSITFYPKIFAWLLLVPQVVYILINPFRDCGDSSCFFAPNMLAALLDIRWMIYDVVVWISALVAVLSIIIYIAGVIIFSGKIFDAENAVVGRPQKSFFQKIKSGVSFFLILTLCLVAVVFFIMAQGWLSSNFFTRFLFSDGADRGEKIVNISPEDQCWAIVDKERKNSCYRRKIIGEATEKQDATICEKIITDKIDGCLLRMGVVGEVSVCDSRDGCYALVAKRKGDLAVCDAIKNLKIKCVCYGNIALNKKDETLCDGCSGEVPCEECAAYSGNCYSDVAWDKKDPSICGMIREPEPRDFCYDRLAWYKRDILICNAILDRERKEDCRADIIGN
jgi:hypothetical protein